MAAVGRAISKLWLFLGVWVALRQWCRHGRLSAFLGREIFRDDRYAH